MTMKLSKCGITRTAVFIAATVTMMLASMPLSAKTKVEFIPWYSSVICEGEQIDFEGRMQYIIHDEYDGGRLNLHWQLNYKGKGYGLDSGDEYLAKQNMTDSFHDVSWDPPLPTVAVYNDHGIIIGKGDAPNYTYRVKAKLIVANDKIVVDTFEFEPGECVLL
jgi:hypothetical protein